MSGGPPGQTPNPKDCTPPPGHDHTWNRGLLAPQKPQGLHQTKACLHPRIASRPVPAWVSRMVRKTEYTQQQTGAPRAKKSCAPPRTPWATAPAKSAPIPRARSVRPKPVPTTPWARRSAGKTHPNHESTWRVEVAPRFAHAHADAPQQPAASKSAIETAKHNRESGPDDQRDGRPRCFRRFERSAKPGDGKFRRPHRTGASGTTGQKTPRRGVRQNAVRGGSARRQWSPHTGRQY